MGNLAENSENDVVCTDEGVNCAQLDKQTNFLLITRTKENRILNNKHPLSFNNLFI